MSLFKNRSIVVPVDFSEPSLAAVCTALSLTADPSRIHVLHVLPEISAAAPGVIWDAVSDESRCEHAKTRLKQWLSDTQFAGIELTATVGDPGHKITGHAQAAGADLIVIPSHGRTGLKRLLIGSVAERVVRLAHCPVLVLRHQEKS
jgi:nucleotide-binding universal stress UspA family protein